jgi:hypothetical protein
MNFFTLLKQEHKEAKETFDTLLNQEEIDRKETEILFQKLLLHMEMEEKCFYPLMENYKATEELSEEAELEHTEAKKYIRQILSDKLHDVEYKVKLEMLQLCIEHHAKEEEKELFPIARKKLSEKQIQSITEDMMALKQSKQEKASHRY